MRMGKALRDGYRDKVFLMTKIDGRSKTGAAAQIDESLRRLQTDHVDLLQFHEIIRMDDPDRIFAPGGALEAVLEAKKAGKLRYIGFTGHKDPSIHLHMLQTAAQHQFRFDTVQMPLNVMDAHYRSFEHQVLPVLLKEQIGVLGMKSMGSGDILKSKAVQPIECLQDVYKRQVMGSSSWAEEKAAKGMIYRTLGSTGQKVSAIGLGGFHIGNPVLESESLKIIRSAIDRGITFMDNCWDYHEGKSEVRMGKALRDGYRDKVFLMTKIDGRSKTGAAAQIEESLRRLQTDHRCV